MSLRIVTLSVVLLKQLKSIFLKTIFYVKLILLIFYKQFMDLSFVLLILNLQCR